MSGMEIVATHRYDEIVDGLDTLVVVGGTGCEEASKDPALVEWVRSVAPKARRVASVCSGAFICPHSEQRAERVEGIEAPIQSKREFVEVGL